MAAGGSASKARRAGRRPAPPATADIERTEFESGLRVVTEHVPAARSVTLGLWVTAGSRDEHPRIAGASHFLEHLLFKGTPTRSAREIADMFDAVGGDFNAFTSKEHTCYYTRVLDRDLPMAVDLMSDMFQRAVLKSGDLESERQVILEEINMHEDTPDELIHDLFAQTLWGEHPLGRPILGTGGSIREMSRDQVRRFYRRHYHPANLIVSAAGHVDHEQLIELLGRNLEVGRVRRSGSSAWKLREGRDVPKPSGDTLVRNRKTEQAHIVVGTNGLSRRDPDRFAFSIVNAALGGGMSSRLFQEIREKRGLAYSVFSYHQMYAETGLWSVYAGCSPNRADEVVGLIRDEMARVLDEGLTTEELDRAKGHMKGSMVLSLEETSGRMSRLAKSEIGHGEILSVDEILERFDAITLDDARAAAERVLSQRMSLTVLGPFRKRDFDGSDASAEAAVAAHHGGPG